MDFKLFLESLESVPPPPGATPVPPGNVRLYHYINLRNGMNADEAIANIKKNGININLAKGTSYGEPNQVWASTQKPNRGKIYVEFFMPWEDSRWWIGKPRSLADIDWLQKSGADVTFGGSIQPEEIIAIHFPWHETYRYLVSHNMIPRVLVGEFDNLLKDPNSNEAKAIEYIKRHRV